MTELEATEQLSKTNKTFMHLKEEHQRYEKELAAIATLSFPTKEQERKIADLKKKKLLNKDQMETMVKTLQS